MPLPNRVDPFGNLFADPARGLYFGNRGGRFHRDDRTLGRADGCRAPGFVAGSNSRGDIATSGVPAIPSCSSSMSRPRCPPGIARASSAGARMRGRSPPPSPPGAIAPPFLARPTSTACCMLSVWTGVPSGSTRAGSTICPTAPFSALADEPGRAFAVRGPALLPWTPAGYAAPRSRPRATIAEIITPPGILAALSAGYRPRWHPSADR